MQAASSKILTKRSSNCSTTSSQMLFPVKKKNPSQIVFKHFVVVWYGMVHLVILPLLKRPYCMDSTSRHIALRVFGRN